MLKRRRSHLQNVKIETFLHISLAVKKIMFKFALDSSSLENLNKSDEIRKVTWEGSPRRAKRANCCQGGHGRERESLHFVERRLLWRSSLSSELRTLRTLRSDAATVDVLGMCLYAFLYYKRKAPILCPYSSIIRYLIFISAWASELLIFLRRQVRRPGTRDK